MHFKRKHSHRRVRCTLCTQNAWRGNTAERLPIRDQRARQDDGSAVLLARNEIGEHFDTDYFPTRSEDPDDD